MRRAYLAIVVVGVLALLAVGLARSSTLAYSPGTVPAGPAVTVAAGQVVCQTPIAPPEGTRFDRVVLFPAAPGGRADVLVRVVGGRELGTGRLTAARSGPVSVAVGEQHPLSAVEVCVTGRGTQPLVLLGAFPETSPHTEARLDGQPQPRDVALRLEGEGRPLLALAPAMAERASRFRPDWVGPWLYAVLAGVVVLGVPLLLLGALSAARGASAEGA